MPASIVILLMRAASEDDFSMKLWAWDKKNFPSIAHATRTAVAATLSLALLGQQIRRNPPSGDSSVNLFIGDSLRQSGARFCHLHS